ELGIRAHEHARERAAVEVARKLIGGVQGALLVHLEEGLAILLRAAQLAPLGQDDGPREDRSQCEETDHELNEPTRLPDQAECIDARETSPQCRPTDDAHWSPHTSVRSRLGARPASSNPRRREGEVMEVTVDSRGPAQAEADLLALPMAQLGKDADSLPPRLSALDRTLGGRI